MTLTLYGAHRDVALDDLGSLFDVARSLGPLGPELKKLQASQYGTYTASPAQVRQLLEELRELQRRYATREKQQIARDKKVHARDPATRERILDGFLANDPWTKKLRDIIDVCDAALAAGESVTAVGD